MPRSLLLLLLLLLQSFSFLTTALSGPSTATSIYVACSQRSKLPSSYTYSLNSLLSSLANAAVSSPYATSSADLHGLFQCRATLPLPDCTLCVHSAAVQLPLLCPSASSAALQLQGCLLRYSTGDFLGRPDHSLRFNRCTDAAAHDPALAEMRGAVLSGLDARQGMYREARFGYMGGAAQCVGDQSLEECGECVGAAVARAKATCGNSSAAGEVYLGGCYVEYMPWRLHMAEDGRGHRLRRSRWWLCGAVLGTAAALLAVG